MESSGLDLPECTNRVWLAAALVIVSFVTMVLLFLLWVLLSSEQCGHSEWYRGYKLVSECSLYSMYWVLKVKPDINYLLRLAGWMCNCSLVLSPGGCDCSSMYSWQVGISLVNDPFLAYL